LTPPIRTGLHLSIADSLAAAALRAVELGAATFQIFTSSPRMWRASVLRPADIVRMTELRLEHKLWPLVVHGNYLINLPSSDAQIRRNSIASFRGELERAAAVAADYLVIHPGSFKDQTPETAIARFAAAVAEACDGIAPGGVTLLLENTAGQGSALGSRIEELAALKAAVTAPVEIGFCLDTCHLLAAGYDIASADGLEAALELAGHLLGFDSIPVIHANDSKAPAGSRVDRHEHIGKGHIGEAAFARILKHPRLAGKAFLLETPVEEEGDERRNLQALQRLAGFARWRVR
jgi:deoxyribonuclease-4